MIILDVGCGDGNKTERFIDVKVIGVDLSEQMIQKAKRKYPDNEWYVENPLNGLHFEDDTFDLIYSFSFLQYFSPKTYRILMKELGRVLKPEGKIMHMDIPNKYKFFRYNICNKNKRMVSDFFTNRYNDDGSRWWKFRTAKKYVKDMFIVKKFKSECWYRINLMFWKNKHGIINLKSMFPQIRLELEVLLKDIKCFYKLVNNLNYNDKNI